MAGPDDSDEELMRRYASGDVAAFEALYERHERRIWRYLTRNLRDPATAEELMQEVWFTVARQAAAYRPTARFTTWLYTLSHHRMIDVLRARRPAVRLDELDDADAQHAQALAAPRSTEPDALLQDRQQQQRLLAALARLPLEQRGALLMHLDGELSVEEIAAATGTSFETAKSRLRYARAKLRELLAEEP